jgi:glutamyl-tRNA synthetase
MTAEALQVLNNFASAIEAVNEWSLDAIKALIKEFCITQNIKMPQLGMPLRLKLCGTTQTPSFDAIIHILGKNNVLARLRA